MNVARHSDGTVYPYNSLKNIVFCNVEVFISYIIDLHSFQHLNLSEDGEISGNKCICGVIFFHNELQ